MLKPSRLSNYGRAGRMAGSEGMPSLYNWVVVLRLLALPARVDKVYDGKQIPLYFRSLTQTKTFPWHAETKELVSQDGLVSVAEIM